MTERNDERATYVAFVRAVMQGRDGLHREVLVDLFADAGAVDVVTYLTTGNVSFRLAPAELPRLVDDVEAGLEEIVGRRAELFVRTPAELRAIVALDAFAHPPFDDANELVVTFFADRVPAGLELPIVSPRGDTSTFLATERELFSVGHRVDGRQSAPGGRLEKLTGQRLTTRAISTIERIAAAVAERA